MLALIVTVVSLIMFAVVIGLLINLHRENGRWARTIELAERRQAKRKRGST